MFIYYTLLAQCLLLQQLQQLLLPGSGPVLEDSVERVEEGVDGRVERQDEDSQTHPYLTGDGHLAPGQQTQQANGEPAQEVGHGHTEQTAGDVHVLCLPFSADSLPRQAVVTDSQVDTHLWLCNKSSPSQIQYI